MSRQTVFDIWPDSEYRGLHCDIRKEIDAAIEDAVEVIMRNFTVGTWRTSVNGKWIVEAKKSEIMEAIKSNKPA